MSIRLDPLPAGRFAGFLTALLPGYAASRARADRIPLAEAERDARRQLDALLPAGVATPGHLFLRILAGPDDREVGTLWLHLDAEAGVAFVYDIAIAPEARRRGHGAAAMAAAEALAREAGCRRIALDVFAPNRAARRLYETLGYEAVSLHLNKALAVEPAPDPEADPRPRGARRARTTP